MSGTGRRKKTETTEAEPASAPAGEAPAVPTVDSVLTALSTDRLLDLCRLFGCEVHDLGGGKDRLVRKLATQMVRRLPAVLRELGRDELRAVCRRHGLDAGARARADLQAAVLVAAGLDPKRWDPLESTCRHASLSIL